MSLLSFVKVSNVSSLSDARYCAGMGVDILGFNIDPTSANCLQSEDYEEITQWVAGVRFAGEFTTANLSDIKLSLEQNKVDLIELNDYNLLDEVSGFGIPIIYKYRIETVAELSEFDSKLERLTGIAEIVILKSSNIELNDALDDKLEQYDGELRLVKGYGVEAHLLNKIYPGLELEATKEEKPGLKDYGEIMDILEKLDEDQT